MHNIDTHLKILRIERDDRNNRAIARRNMLVQTFGDCEHCQLVIDGMTVTVKVGLDVVCTVDCNVDGEGMYVNGMQRSTPIDRISCLIAERIVANEQRV